MCFTGVIHSVLLGCWADLFVTTVNYGRKSFTKNFHQVKCSVRFRCKLLNFVRPQVNLIKLFTPVKWKNTLLRFSLLTEGTTEKVSQFIIQQKLFYIKTYVLMIYFCIFECFSELILV
jgi:hypothetical protein